jgi:hypothetical protein
LRWRKAVAGALPHHALVTGRAGRRAVGGPARGSTMTSRHPWALLANASRARLFEVDREGGRVHPADLGDERGGHTQRGTGDGGSGGASFEPRTDTRHKEREHFARELAVYLDAALAQHRFQSLLLLASNPFLGELRAHLAPATARAVQVCEPLDIGGLAAPELARRVMALAAQPAA